MSLPSSTPASKLPLETDTVRVEQRQKQVDFGRNTLGYRAYLDAVPRHMRKKTDPSTPGVCDCVCMCVCVCV